MEGHKVKQHENLYTAVLNHQQVRSLPVGYANANHVYQHNVKMHIMQLSSGVENQLTLVRSLRSYEACSKTIETITILSKRLNSIQRTWSLSVISKGLNYLMLYR